MFRVAYRNTLKSLFRSVTFWLVAFVFCFIVLPYMSGNSQGTNEWFYVQYVDNLICSKTLPIFSITLAVLTLNSDYGNSFYEIEKARSVKLSTYLLGRISAISTVALGLSAIVSFICVYVLIAMAG